MGGDSLQDLKESEGSGSGRSPVELKTAASDINNEESHFRRRTPVQERANLGAHEGTALAGAAPKGPWVAAAAALVPPKVLPEVGGSKVEASERKSMKHAGLVEGLHEKRAPVLIERFDSFEAYAAQSWSIPPRQTFSMRAMRAMRALVGIRTCGDYCINVMRSPCDAQTLYSDG